MDFCDKLQRIIELEGINLKEFSELTGITYGMVRKYNTGDRSPSLPQIQKIISVPRFTQYKNMLLSLDELINEELNEGENRVIDAVLAEKNIVIHASSSKRQAALELFKRLEEIGRGAEALAILEALEASAKMK